MHWPDILSHTGYCDQLIFLVYRCPRICFDPSCSSILHVSNINGYHLLEEGHKNEGKNGDRSEGRIESWMNSWYTDTIVAEMEISKFLGTVLNFITILVEEPPGPLHITYNYIVKVLDLHVTSWVHIKYQQTSIVWWKIFYLSLKCKKQIIHVM